MLCYAMLNYAILYYTILCYTILYYTILYHSNLYYTILYHSNLYYTILCLGSNNEGGRGVTKIYGGTEAALSCGEVLPSDMFVMRGMR